MVQKTDTRPRAEVINAKLALDPAVAVDEICGFVEDVFSSSGATGIVIGLSGGVDSAVTASLCSRAVGSEKVTGLLLFEKRMLAGQDHGDALAVAELLGITKFDFPIDPVISGFSEEAPFGTVDRTSVGNLKARIRMTALYLVANSRKLLVAGTGDRSEDLIGYFTKYGDGGVDFLPIAHLYKSQVKQLGRYLGLPIEIIEKPSSPNLWEGHKATDEIPLDYDTLDRALVCLFDLKLTAQETASVTGVEQGKIQEIVNRFHLSAHKRTYPPMVRSW